MTDARLANPRQEIEAALEAGDVTKLLLMTGMLHGHFCTYSAMGVRAAARAMRELGVKNTGMEEVVAIVETNNCFSDGVQFVTGCTFGNNALIYRDYGKTAFTLARRTGEAVRVGIKSEWLTAEPTVEAAELFRKVVVERGGTAEEKQRFGQLYTELSFKLMDVPDEGLLEVSRTTTEIPEFAPIFSSVICSECGDVVMETRARFRNGKPVCVRCSRAQYYQLAGDGISCVTGGYASGE